VTTAIAASGPRGRLLTGNLPDFAADPLGFLTQVSRDYGPVASLRFGRSRALLVSDPALLEEVLVKKRSSFIKARPLRAQRRLFGDGLLTNEGDSWKRQRQLAQPAFHPRRLNDYAPIVVRRASEMFDAWIPRETRDLHHDMKDLLMNISAETMFGASVASRASGIGSALEATMERYAGRRGISRLLPDAIPLGANGRYTRGVRDIHDFVSGMISSRQSSRVEHSDLLSILLSAKDELGNPMSFSQIRDEAITLFVGAFDTPALCLSWTWYLLSTHPDIAAKLAREVDIVLGDTVPRMKDVEQLSLTGSIVKESMRMFPPAWLLSREAVEDTVVGGSTIRKGTSVLMSQWVMHRDERFFSDPLTFNPERWAHGSAPPAKFTYFPFGAGPRVCIGAAFATMEITLILAMMAQRFRFELANSGEIVPHASMTLRPRGGVPIRVTPREHAHASAGTPMLTATA
jgi:cytochrome P450